MSKKAGGPAQKYYDPHPSSLGAWRKGTGASPELYEPTGCDERRGTHDLGNENDIYSSLRGRAYSFGLEPVFYGYRTMNRVA